MSFDSNHVQHACLAVNPSKIEAFRFVTAWWIVSRTALAISNFDEPSDPNTA
jgi:hypothetical protein